MPGENGVPSISTARTHEWSLEQDEKPGHVKVSLGIFGEEHAVRLFCTRVMKHKAFKATVLGLILANCVVLAMTEPFATCCSQQQKASSDVHVIGVDSSLYNFTVKCNMLNRLEDHHQKELGKDCCIDASALEPDDYNKCASASLRALQESAESFFNLMFTIEMLIKIIALGFFMGRESYLRNSWNLLDFVVVVFGWLSYVPGIANLSMLRTFRVLRPLRTLTSIPGMRPIVVALITCVKSMVHVMMLCAFLFTVFGIIGLQLFSGTLKGRCHYVDPSSIGNFDKGSAFSGFSLVEDDTAPCPLPCETHLSADSKEVFPIQLWARGGKDCLTLSGISCHKRDKVIIANPFFDPDSPPSQVTKSTTLPIEMLSPLGTPQEEDGFQVNLSQSTIVHIYNSSDPVVVLPSFCLNTGENQLGDGYAHFDSIGYAWLTILTSITLEGWTDVMYGLQASFGYSFVIFMYFFVMVWLCSFFMLELTLAVINEAYEKAAEKDRTEEEELSLKQQKSSQEIPVMNVGTFHESGFEPGEHPKIAKFSSTRSLETALEGTAKLEPWGPKGARTLFWLVNTQTFSSIITVLIILNTITLGMEHHGMSLHQRNFLEGTNIFFTICFSIELILKVIGLGPHQYARDAFNIFDFVIVTISLVELGVGIHNASEESYDQGGTGLGALRTFRLMRVFKLARSWKNLRKLLHTILLSIIDVTNAAILLVIIMFIFTLLGMQLFGGDWTAVYFCSDPKNYELCLLDTPRPNFDSFWWGFVTVFQVLTGENWNELLYIGLRVHGEIAVVYFVALNLIGTYMVLNLFLAILLARFELEDEQEEEEEERLKREEQTALQAKKTKSFAAVAPMPAVVKVATSDEISPVEDKARDRSSSVDVRVMREADDETLQGENSTNIQGKKKPRKGANLQKQEKEPNKMTMNPTAKAFFIFPPEMPLRRFVFKVVSSDSFDNFILVLITLSTILLAVEEPYIEECRDTTCKSLFTFLFVMDLILTVFFFAEMILKMFALGVVMHENAYLRSGWNILDFIIVIISLLSLAMGGDGTVKALKSLRSLRALRPLRVISRSPGMRLVVNSIIAAIPAIANVTVVVLLFMLIFAVIGVQNFSGGLNSCNDPELRGPDVTKFDCVGFERIEPPPGHVPLTWIPRFEDCQVLPLEELITQCLRNGTGGCETCYEGGGFPRIWAPNGGYQNSFNYDNLGQSLLVVFEVVSGEMWPNIMYATMDITGPDQPMLQWPHRRNQTVAIWFILVTLICSFLMINVFVGVIIDNFNDMKDVQNGSGLLTEQQKIWLATMKKTLQEKPKKQIEPPKENVRAMVWFMVQTPVFEVSIMFLILLNTLVMMLQSDGQSDFWRNFTLAMNSIFLAAFAIEACLKIFAFRREYFHSAWNCFDFTLVLFGLVGMVGGLGPLASLLRIFRVARIFRLVRTSPGLLTIFRTLLFSIPSILNVGGIFLLLILIYAILGMNLFSNIKQGEFLNGDANFNGFFISVATLFRVTTGESFNGIMHDCMIQEPYCSDAAGNCGFLGFAPLYFCSYFLCSAYTLLSMITAIILDQFADQDAAAHNAVKEEDIEEFKTAWAILDPKGTMFIHEELLVKLVMRVPYPLGVRQTPRSESRGRSNRKLANGLIRSLDIPTIKGSVAFQDVLTELTSKAMSKAMPEIEIPEENQLVQRLKDKKDDQQIKLLRKLGTSKDNILYTAAQVNAIMLIQSAMRGFIYRAKLQELMKPEVAIEDMKPLHSDLLSHRESEEDQSD